MIISSILFCALSGVPVSEMADVLTQRHAAHDRLVVELTHRHLKTSNAIEPLDESGWSGFGDVDFQHRLTVVRPNVLDEFLTDARQRGYVPVTTALVDGAYCAQHVQPTDQGKHLYHQAEMTLGMGIFRWAPILQVFDLQLQDSPIDQLTIERLFREHPVTLISGDAESSTYRADIEAFGTQWRYEMRLDPLGTPIRITTTITPPRANLANIVWTQHTLRTEMVAGYPFPMESVVTVSNPNVAAGQMNVHHVVVNCLSHDTTLSAAAVTLTPATPNAVIYQHHRDGRIVRRDYDEAGALVQEELLDRPGSSLASGASLRWRIAVPPIALVFGLGIASIAHFVTRRRGK